jgi:hypothetical protein
MALTLGQRNRIWPEPALSEARNQTDRLPLSSEDDLTAPDGLTARRRRLGLVACLNKLAGLR